jgi:hypothetical protein
MAITPKVRNDRAADKDDRNSNDRPHDLIPDLVGVGSRVSWSAILAGAVIAFACFTALTFFFGAVGVTLTEAGVRDRAVGIGALVAAIASIIVSLFIGGCVAARMTVGENREEAVMYGVLTWGVVTLASIATVAMGVRAGYFAAVGGTVAVQNNERISTWEDMALAAGVSQQSINEAKNSVDPARIRAQAADPANQEKAREAAVYAAWIALVGTMLSLAACIIGSMVGRGVAFHLYPVRVVRHDRVVVPAAP